MVNDRAPSPAAVSRPAGAAVVGALALVLLLVIGSPAAAGPAPALVTVTSALYPRVAAPDVVAPPVGCPGAQVPPPPAADEELAAAPAPLPWPAAPVGGPQMAACGDVLAPGFAVPPGITAAAWLVADLDTGAVLASRAPHARHRPASTLKVLTALVALDRLDPDTVVEGTVADAGIDGSRAGIGPGGRYTVRQLLAGLLLNSGNDAAHALARSLGGPQAFTAAMDATARRYGALDTRAATPSGLDGPGMASSAYDLAVLFRVALRDPLFAEVTATRSVPFPGHGEQPGFTLTNSDKLVARYPGALGGKTGFTDAARHAFVGAAQRDGRRLVVALVRGEQAPVPMWRQAATLLDAGFATPGDSVPLGTLVDATPAAPVSPAVGPGAVPATLVPRPVAPFALAAAACAGAGGLLLLRRARRR
ncbi:MAG: D-alanyl-D-alanine carboxypeptidase family protein [Pseudonocardia sp.]